MPYVGLHVFVALAAAGVLFAPSIRAAPHAAIILAADDGVMVHEAWARASAGASTTGAVYVTLVGGAQADNLVSVSTPVAATAEVHETIDDKGIMKMRPIAVIAVPPGQIVTFAPGGTHIMLMGLKQQLRAGQSFPLTLTFAHAAPVTVDVRVEGLGARANGSNGSMSDHTGSHDGMPMHSP
jgi:copper(I)-binding protein